MHHPSREKGSHGAGTDRRTSRRTVYHSKPKMLSGGNMPSNRDWSKPMRRLELLMRLRSFPVAFKLLEKKEDLNHIPFLRRMDRKRTLCQMITLVRSFDW